LFSIDDIPKPPAGTLQVVGRRWQPGRCPQEERSPQEVAAGLHRRVAFQTWWGALQPLGIKGHMIEPCISRYFVWFGENRNSTAEIVEATTC